MQRSHLLPESLLFKQIIDQLWGKGVNPRVKDPKGDGPNWEVGDLMLDL